MTLPLENRPETRTSWPVVTVVILAFNRKETLAITLEKITSALEYPADRLEVIVVDNASEDGTPEMVARDFPRATLLVNEKNIGVAGWNRGFKMGRGDFFLILDDDCYLTGAALKRAVEAAEARRADLVSFTVVAAAEEGVSFNARYNTGLLSFWGCSALVSKRALDQLKGYDEHIFLWANELEFTIRLLDHGLRHLFLKDVVAVHMKTPREKGVYAYRGHKRNVRNFAYIAGKLFQRGDAVAVVFNLLLEVLITTLRRPRALFIVPALIEGFRTGVQNRQPVRKEVSSLYARHFHGFVNPVLFKLRLRKWARFFRERADLYPEQTAVFSL